MADQHVEQVLTAAGITPEVITELKGLAADAADFTPDKYLAPVRTIFETRLENDPEFLKKIMVDEKIPADVKKGIETGQYGRFMNEIKAILLSKGVTEDEIKDGWEKKSIKGLLNQGFDGYTKKIGNTETLTKLQGDLANALQEKEALSTKQAELIEQAVNGAKSESQVALERMVTKVTIGELNGMVIGENKYEFKVAPSIIAPMIHDGVKAKHAVVLNPATQEYELRQLANPALKVLKTDGTELTYREEAFNVAKANNLLDEKKVDAKGVVITKVVNVNGDDVKDAPKVEVPDYIKEKSGIK